MKLVTRSVTQDVAPGRAVTCSCGAHNFGQSTWMTLANYAPHDPYCSRITRTFIADQTDYTGIVRNVTLDNRGNFIA